MKVYAWRFGVEEDETLQQTAIRRKLGFFGHVMPPRRGGSLRASAWNGWWPDCGVWVTCQRIFRASRLSLRRQTETYSSQFHNVLLTSYSIYSSISPPLRDPSVLGRITSYCPLKTIGIFFLRHYIMPSAL